MECMMGVKERFDLENHEMSSKFSARIRTIYSVFKIIISLIRLPKSRRRFLKFVDATIADYKQVDCHNEPPEKLMNHYKKFEKILTEQWNPPLVNDFFAMIYFGVFQKLVGKWIDPDNPHLHNDLLSHNNDIISVQPMIKSLEIAKKITQNPEATKLFQLPPKTTWKNLQNNHFPEIKSDIDAFLYKFGERCLGELKLETISYTQAPEKFIKILQAYVNNPDSLLSLDKNNGKSIRQASQQQVTSSLKNKFFKKLIFNYFLRKTRNLVSNRENLRFERTRGFGIVRAIFSAMGYQFQQMKLIQHERDIFYLTKEEIFDYINGTSYTENLMDLIASRKSEFASFEKDAHVPERITTFGTVYNQLDFDIPEESILDGDIKGTACCPGIVQAEVCIIHSPDEISDLQGKIMVTSSTDPGWVSLFPSASGILVERGSLLSHTAIVDRELGIPCIVGIKDLLKQLKSGDRVEMDGSTGFVKIIKS